MPNKGFRGFRALSSASNNVYVANVVLRYPLLGIAVTVIGHAMATVRNQTDRQKMNRTATFGQAVFAILRKSKREATPLTSQRKLLHICFCPTALRPLHTTDITLHL